MTISFISNTIQFYGALIIKTALNSNISKHLRNFDSVLIRKILCKYVMKIITGYGYLYKLVHVVTSIYEFKELFEHGKDNNCINFCPYPCGICGFTACLPTQLLWQCDMWSPFLWTKSGGCRRWELLRLLWWMLYNTRWV